MRIPVCWNRRAAWRIAIPERPIQHSHQCVLRTVDDSGLTDLRDIQKNAHSMRMGCRARSAGRATVLLTIFGAGLLFACNGGGEVADTTSNRPAAASTIEAAATQVPAAESSANPTPTAVEEPAAAPTATERAESAPSPATLTSAAEPAESESDAAADGVREIRIDTTAQRAFSPSDIDVEPGETVRFVLSNESPFAHTFTIAAASSKEEILVDVELAGNATESVEFTFPAEPAELYLFCRPHEAAGMVGSVHVGDASESSSAPAEPAASPKSDDSFGY